MRTQAEVTRALKKILSAPRYRFARMLPAPAKVYLVGGAVRDALLGLTPKDLDFVVTGISAAVLERELHRAGEVLLIESRAFGVFKFTPHGDEREPIDVALPRLERQTGKGYKDFAVTVDPSVTIEADLSRRDFTINALALDIASGELLDPFGGARDIAASRIRAVGDPARRFREDPSRILRAVRFACLPGFTLEAKTKQAARAQSAQVTASYRVGSVRKERVAREVIGKELIKALTLDPLKMLMLYDELKLTARLLPEVIDMKKCTQPKNFHSEGDVLAHSKLAVESLLDLPAAVNRAARIRRKFMAPDAELILTVLLHDVGKPAAKFKKGRRVVYYGHPEIGAELAAKMIERLKLNEFGRDSGYYVDKDRVRWLIKEHLFALNVDARQVSLTALEKRFFRPDGWGERLIALAWADSLSSVKADGQPQLDRILLLDAKLRQMSAARARAPKIIQPLMTGDEIMALLKLAPGKAVGLAKLLLLEGQLEGKINSKSEAATALYAARDAIKRLAPAEAGSVIGLERQLD